MYELQQVGSQSYYINCPAKIGVYVRSYLSWMKDRGVIDYSVDNSMLLWKTVE